MSTIDFVVMWVGGNDPEWQYVKNQSFILDLKCILATVKAVLIREGAK